MADNRLKTHWWRTGGEFKKKDPRVVGRNLVNHNFFCNTSELPAYWAGFLYADGGVVEGANSPVIHLELSDKDVAHVEKFKARTGSTGKIYHRERDRKGLSGLHIVSEQMAKDLAGFGVIPRKTYVADPGEIVRFDRHFWRGVVDGDGTVGVYFGIPRLQLVGAGNTCERFIEFLHACGVYTKATAREDKNSKAKVIALNGANAVDAIRILYSGATEFLDRKITVAREIMSLGLKPRYRPLYGGYVCEGYYEVSTC